MTKGQEDREHRRPRPCKILSEDKIKTLAACLLDTLPQPLLDQLRLYGIDAEEHVWFMAVAPSLTERREAKGVDIKTLARQLKVPQYRLRDIEAGRFSQIVPAVLIAYIDPMELTEWFDRWQEANPELAVRIGLLD